ncbi:MAG: hypothetical protein KC425_19000 [Anaerolineales bacterium]|nr:hypothetical protein [Anaerolineales bacterium]
MQKRPGLSVFLGVVVGIVLGLLWGWVIQPVEYTDASPAALHPDDQVRYIRLAADNYFLSQSNPNLQMNPAEAFRSWPNAAVRVCELAAQTTDPAEQQRLNQLAVALNGQGCAPVAGDTAVPAEEGGGLGSVLLLFLMLAVLIVAIFLVWSRRNAASGDDMFTRPAYDEVPEAAPVVSQMADDGVTAVPIARFRTNYTRGHDAYDDSFSIENASGDFLGECGVGISESIGADSPKNVTAFEVWLFDKNDIRTITKVIMSDHAFFDDAIKAKLATKGEQVLAREGETVVLETASLIINAEITEMQYGVGGTLPPQSYFESVTFELSAWAKEGETAGNGGVTDVMNF